MRALLARARTISPAAVWFPALALIVAGPLLGSGYLLLLDWPSGPQFPRVDFFPQPSSGAVGNTAPLDALLAALRGVHQYLPDKMLLIAPIVLGGVGVHRFVRSRLGIGAWGGILGGTLFVVNPWVIDRYLSGHLYILLAYSLLPWALLPLFDAVAKPSLRPALLAGVWLFGLGLIDLHVAGMYLLLTVVCLLVAPSRRRVLYLAGSLGLAALLSAFWLVPALVSPPGIRVGAEDLVVYASRPRGYDVLPTLAAMYGFWRNEFVGPAGRIPGLFVLLLPILGLVGFGAGRLLSLGPVRRFAVVLAAVGILALLFSAGTSFPPTAGVFSWVYDQVNGFRIYREPQKFLAIVILAYAVCAAVGLHRVVAGQVRWLAGVLTGMGLAAVLVYGYTQLWGFWHQVHLSHYPSDWYQAQHILEKQGDRGSVLFLPWHLYAVWTFSDGRIAANPAPSFFSTHVLANGEAGFQRVPPQSSDRTERYVRELLSRGERIRRLGHLLASLDVQYVALAREVDHWNYQFVSRQTDLVVAYSGSRLTLFENLAWKASDWRHAESRLYTRVKSHQSQAMRPIRSDNPNMRFTRQWPPYEGF